MGISVTVCGGSLPGYLLLSDLWEVSKFLPLYFKTPFSSYFIKDSSNVKKGVREEVAALFI